MAKREAMIASLASTLDERMVGCLSLGKLEMPGLVGNRLGGYSLVWKVRVSVVKSFLRFGGYVAPGH